MELRGTMRAPQPRKRKDPRVGPRRRVHRYKRPLTDPSGAVVGYLDRWGNAWVIRVLGPNGEWHWKEVQHGYR